MRLTYLLLVTLPALFAGANPAQNWNTGGGTGSPASGENCSGGNITSQSDIDLLNYALALANLQNAFYQQNLGNIDDNAFSSSGFGQEARNNFNQISQNKQAQVNLLAQTLGACATPACNYDFHVTNATNFTATAVVIEDIGTSAYVGSIGDLSNSTLQEWAAAILSSNARAAAYVTLLTGAQPVIGPFDTPLTPQEVATLTSSYITSCPDNSTNPFHPGNNLLINQASPNEAQFIFNSSTGNQQLWAVFHKGLGKTIVPLNSNNVAVIPANTTGIVFAEVSNSGTVANDGTIIAGPGVINIPVANGSNGTVPVNGPTTSIASSAATSGPTSSAPASSEPVPTSTSTTSEQSTVVVTATSEQSTVVVTATSSA
ncbi:hypothetical protein H0H87_011371 [Tephrocybe sp. NHM501043]|nr:hypothetical protein H0H87_011371 [Tephrocybe sp. NHM501043]